MLSQGKGISRISSRLISRSQMMRWEPLIGLPGTNLILIIDHLLILKLINIEVKPTYSKVLSSPSHWLLVWHWCPLNNASDDQVLPSLLSSHSKPDPVFLLTFHPGSRKMVLQHILVRKIRLSNIGLQILNEIQIYLILCAGVGHWRCTVYILNSNPNSLNFKKNWFLRMFDLEYALEKIQVRIKLCQLYMQVLGIERAHYTLLFWVQIVWIFRKIGCLI